MQNLMRVRHNPRRGFTLIELVVVVLILGIIGAVAAPKMFNTMVTAKQNSAKQSVQIVRAAIEMYKSQQPTNSYPPDAASLGTVLIPYLKGPFPICSMTNQNSTVFLSATAPLTVVGATTEGWIYNPTTGDFGINDAIGITY